MIAEKPTKKPRVVSRVVCGLLFTLAGFWHFARPDVYLKIMPPWLPWHLEMVYLSGVVEIAGGALLLFDRTRRLGSLTLIALLIGVFPANIYMAIRADLFPNIPYALLLLRLPLQAVLIFWVWKCGR